MKSILQEKKECYVTGRTYGLHKHHVFEGTANRKKSDKLTRQTMEEPKAEPIGNNNLPWLMDWTKYRADEQ